MTRTHACTLIRAHAHKRIHTHARTHTHTHIHEHAHAHTHTRTHGHTHKNTHAHSHASTYHDLTQNSVHSPAPHPSHEKHMHAHAYSPTLTTPPPPPNTQVHKHVHVQYTRYTLSTLTDPLLHNRVDIWLPFILGTLGCDGVLTVVPFFAALSDLGTLSRDSQSFREYNPHWSQQWCTSSNAFSRKT